MKNEREMVKTALKWFRGLFPMKLPTTVQAFDEFSDWVFKTYGLPNIPNYRGAIAEKIMHLGDTTSYKAPFFFALYLRKRQANQIAYSVIDEIRQQEKKKALAPDGKE